MASLFLMEAGMDQKQANHLILPWTEHWSVSAYICLTSQEYRPQQVQQLAQSHKCCSKSQQYRNHVADLESTNIGTTTLSQLGFGTRKGNVAKPLWEAKRKRCLASHLCSSLLVAWAASLHLQTAGEEFFYQGTSIYCFFPHSRVIWHVFAYMKVGKSYLFVVIKFTKESTSATASREWLMLVCLHVRLLWAWNRSVVGIYNSGI